MKNLLLKILIWKVKWLAKMTLRKYKPRIVGVTGSVGKTSTKDAVCAVLGSKYRVRKNYANFNNELGMSLTILSDARAVRRPVSFFWLGTLIKAVWRLVTRDDSYPEVLVLEYGADRPGDIKNLIDIARPDTSIVTAVGDIPVHVEFFVGSKAVAREKSNLVSCLARGNFAVLNHDDEVVLDMKNVTKARVFTYGFEEGADVQIAQFEHRVINSVPEGITFKLEYGGSFVPVRLLNTFGKVQAYAAAAAACVGLMYGMNLVTISEALTAYEAPRGRMKLIRGLKDSLILDDTYNASPLSMHAALDTLRSLPAKRKVAVLGDMLELGKYSLEAHEAIGRLTAKSADLLYTVGPRAKFLAEAANKSGMAAKNIQSFDVADDALAIVHKNLNAGDLVLVKASRGVHLEKIVEDIRNPAVE